MNKQQAQQLIKDTFETTFDKSRFSGFVRNLLNHIEDAPLTYQGNYMPEKFRKYIKTLERIGKYSDGEHTLDILIITLQKETSLERARTMQRNFIAWYLNGSRGGELKDAALVAYVSPEQTDWRFSLVRMDYRFEKTKTGRIKVKEEFTPARRWSFLVGANEKSHTAQSRLVNILADDEHAPTLSELEEAFNIETVTKEFFLKYRELFLRTKEALDKTVAQSVAQSSRLRTRLRTDFEAKGVDTVNFAKKLLGQIVFLYFLQKKGWFGVGRDDDWGTGSRHFLRGLFEKTHGDYTNFFNDILEPLFYEALRIDRSHDDNYYSRFNCKIPFLNGGLFDPIGNYDWVHTDINLPNDLFSNTRKTKEGDIGDGILDVFDRYNFTVQEDEPLEKEVAIDPELLGKAYEKFNAIRPDNFDEFVKALKSGQKGAENKFNKKFGVYYTPREIVHYMCKQSLINYLHTKVTQASLPEEITRQDIEDLIEVGEMITEHEATALIKEQNIKNGIQKSTEYTALLSKGIRRNAKIIDDWLAGITVCDPAVGSGAFPVGMMTEIVRVRNVLSVFLNDRTRNDYEFKRRCIEYSLYGVDIDSGAVEIAKLRLWLSLVVDEEDIKNIKPLPNLDYKIMQGNSLISEFMGINFDDEPEKENGLMFKDEIDDLIKRFQKKKEEFLNESIVSQKEQLKGEVEQLLIEIFEAKLKKQKGDFFNRLKIIEQKYSVLPNKQQRDELVQQEKEKLYKESGFDLEQAEKQLKEFTSGRQIKPFFLWKLYFSEVFHNKGGFDVVIANPPYKILTKNNTSEQELQFLIKNYNSIKKSYSKNIFTLFIERGIKLSKSYGILTFIVPEGLFKTRSYKECVQELNSAGTVKSIITFSDFVFENAITGNLIFLFMKSVNDQTLKFHFDSYYRLITLDEKSDPIIEKISETNTVPLESICSVFKGMVVKDRQNVIQSSANNGKDIFLLGKSISKWRINKKFYTNYSKLQIVGGTKKIEKHNQIPRILIRRTGADLCCSLLKERALTESTLYSCWSKLPEISNEYLLSLLNSKLLDYFIKKKMVTNEQAFPQILMTDLEDLPLKRIVMKEQQPFITLVDKILDITKDDDYLQNPQKQAKVKALEREIDRLVYDLYGLTEEEVRIVEGETK